eukprot:1697189-Karenia_brevis.AAC.1
MERQVGVFRGEGERVVDVMQDIMVDLRDSNLEAVTRSGRELERRDSRDVMQVERVRPEYIDPRGRWAPEEGRPPRALRDRERADDGDWPPRPPAPVRPAPRRDSTPPQSPET